MRRPCRWGTACSTHASSEGETSFQQLFLSASSGITCMSAGPDGCWRRASIGRLPQERAPSAGWAVRASDLASVSFSVQALKAARGGGGTRAGIGKLPQKRAPLSAPARPPAVLQNPQTSSAPANASAASNRHVAISDCMSWYHNGQHSSLPHNGSRNGNAGPYMKAPSELATVTCHPTCCMYITASATQLAANLLDCCASTGKA